MIPVPREVLESVRDALEDCQMIATGYGATIGFNGQEIKNKFWYANADKALTAIDKILEKNDV